MNLKSFDLNLLRSLDALLSERSVTRAADRVCVSQPTMSGSLQRLREYFEDQLLIRVGREMELTPLARSLVGSVRDVLQSIQSTLDIKPSFDPATAKRTFSMSMSDYAAVMLMPLVLERLAKEAPYISCSIEPLSDKYFDRLSSGDMDFSVAAGNWRLFGADEPGSEIKSELLFSDTFVCIVAKNHPAIDTEVTLDDYKRLPHILVRLAPGVESLIESATANSPANCPSTATSIAVCPCDARAATSHVCGAAAPPVSLRTSRSRRNCSLPTNTCRPPTFAATPRPVTDWKPSAAASCRFFS